MPSFSPVEMDVLKTLADTDWPYARVSNYIYKSLIDKCVAESTGFEVDDNSDLQITEYGRKVLKFYERIRQGEVKSKQSECSECQSNCSSRNG